MRSPGFAAIAILTIAIGVGANATIFSAVHATLLRPLSYPRSSELALIGETNGQTLFSTSPTDVATFAAAATLLAVIAVAASLIPALRASRVDPLVALSEE